MYCFIKPVNCGFSLSETETVSDAHTENLELETEKKTEQIHHDHLIKDYVGIEKIISNYLNV